MQNLLPAFFKTIDQVCVDWNKNQSKKWGFSIDASKKSIKRAHFFAVDLLSNNPALPPSPGPFKTTAAFLVSAMHFVQFDFYPLDKSKPIPDCDIRFWRARFLFNTISIFLLQQKLVKTGQQLQKLWNTPSLHYRLDFLNFIRWCEFPLAGAKPPPPTKPTVDMLRINRLVMAMTLIIEANYYLSGNDIKCDVMNQVHINPADLAQNERPDLNFDA